MIKFLVLLMALLMLLCASCVGCVSCVSCRVIESWGNKAKEVFNLDAGDVTQISDGTNCYTILDETVSRDELGSWVGIIRQIAVVDEDGKILKQKKLPVNSFRAYADLADDVLGAAFVVPFLNVYRTPDGGSTLYVDVNGVFHKAIPSDEVTDEDVRFNFRGAYDGRQVSRDVMIAYD